VTEEQKQQYAICKTRRHEEAVIPYDKHTALRGVLEWSSCRWCGAQFKEIKVTKQVERA
jgi:hypothetical protein